MAIGTKGLNQSGRGKIHLEEKLHVYNRNCPPLPEKGLTWNENYPDSAIQDLQSLLLSSVRTEVTTTKREK
jgi:hypothetical protein